LQITEERRRRVIDLYFNQHKSYAEIAEIEHISPRDIHAIIKEEQARRHKHNQQEISAQAYKLFSEDKTPVEVAIILNLPASKASKLYREYWKLRGLDKLNTIHKETNGKIWPVWKLYQRLVKKNGMSIGQVVNVVDTAIHKLPYMETLYKQLKDEVEKMQRTVQRLANDIVGLERKISILDKTAFSCEQDCRRKHQEIQELIAQKDRIEKLIANILNEEGYSKLKQIIKEYIKAALSEEKKVKADPQMIKLIQNIPRANDGQQHKDNDINVTGYLEFNKDRLLDLAEKNYKNLVEALTNNIIDTASSSSNPPPSLPSSSAFLGPYNKSDTYKTEKEEMFHYSKGDIAN
jgi:hypothetical protein